MTYIGYIVKNYNCEIIDELYDITIIEVVFTISKCACFTIEIFDEFVVFWLFDGCDELFIKTLVDIFVISFADEICEYGLGGSNV